MGALRLKKDENQRSSIIPNRISFPQILANIHDKGQRQVDQYGRPKSQK